MNKPADGLDALAAQLDDLRRDVEGLRRTMDADIDALGSLLDDSLGHDGRPVGAVPFLNADLDEVRTRLQDLADHVSSLVNDPAFSLRLPSWTELNAEQAQAAWTRLARWMTSVLFPRYPAATEMIRDCWYRHPELVEHLSWLHIAWVIAYHNPKSSISTAAEWHSRWLPTVLARAREILKPCYVAHIDDSRVTPDQYRGFGSDFASFVRDDVTRRPPRAEGER